MKSKTLAILALLALALAVLAVVMTNSKDSKSGGTSADVGAPGHEALLFPTLGENVGKVARLHIRRGAVESTLKLEDHTGKPAWVLENRSGYPVEVEHIRQLISGLVDAQVIETKTSKQELYARIGVDDPDKPGAAGTLVEVSDSAGNSLASLIIGNNSRDAAPGSDPVTSKARYFVRRAGEAQCYLARGDLRVQAEPMSWVNRTVLELDGSKVKSAVVTHAAAEGATPDRVAVSKASPSEPVKLEFIPEGRTLKDEGVANRLAQALSSVAMDDVAAAATVDLSSPAATAEFRTLDGMVVTVKMTPKEDKKWFAFSAAYEEPAAAGAPDGATPAPAAGDSPKPDGPVPDLSIPGGAKADAAKSLSAEKNAVKTKVSEFNAEWSGWVFALPEYKSAQLMVKMEDMLKAPEAAPAAPAGQPPVGPDPSTLAPR